MYINQKGNMMAAGMVTRAPELKYVGQKGTPLTSFSIKAGEKPASADGSRPEAIWLEVKCWGDLAKPATAIEKGDRVLVTGKFEARPYTDRNNNQRVSNEINVEFFIRQDMSAVQMNETGFRPNDGYDGFQELPDDDGEVPF